MQEDQILKIEISKLLETFFKDSLTKKEINEYIIYLLMSVCHDYNIENDDFKNTVEATTITYKK